VFEEEQIEEQINKKRNNSRSRSRSENLTGNGKSKSSMTQKQLDYNPRN
jgi:hypothetical protein